MGEQLSKQDYPVVQVNPQYCANINQTNCLLQAVQQKKTQESTNNQVGLNTTTLLLIITTIILQSTANGEVGQHGQNVLGLVANQFKPDHVHAHPLNMRDVPVKAQQKKHESVCYDLVQVSELK